MPCSSTAKEEKGLPKSVAPSMSAAQTSPLELASPDAAPDLGSKPQRRSGGGRANWQWRTRDGDEGWRRLVDGAAGRTAWLKVPAGLATTAGLARTCVGGEDGRRRVAEGWEAGRTTWVKVPAWVATAAGLARTCVGGEDVRRRRGRASTGGGGLGGWAGERIGIRVE
ncbi:unnamed protein product [Cuscuta campestris]|uniref:Uncharacterized protein n=1 Tax=Cuscuta campestris TaxID=132261 RepID=A0A484MB33_9ASTE|nr:unnamed protein product [Cuscuta campestris]